jgi:uncharacterized protein (TIGR02246 family)
MTGDGGRDTGGAAEEPAVVAGGIVRRLEAAWNAADGPAFAAPFAAEADFVDVRGAHHRGREAVAAGHAALFASVYRGSTVRYTLRGARALADGVILAHSDGELRVPAGPLAGEHRATQSVVLVRGAAGWQVASFHNTPVAAPAGPPAGPPAAGAGERAG